MANNKTVNNREIAENVLKAVGGAENVSNATHCMTRLRLNLKDDSIPKDDEVKAIDGVLGVVRSGGQYQVVIGQNVPKVYAEVCNIGGFATKTAADENLDKPAWQKILCRRFSTTVKNGAVKQGGFWLTSPSLHRFRQCAAVCAPQA